MSKSHNPTLEGLLWSWMSFSRRFRAPVILFWFLLAAIGFWLSATLLGVNTDTSEMIDDSVPYRVAQTEFENAFPDINAQILLIIRADSADALSIYSEDLATSLKQAPNVEDVTHLPSDPFFQKNGLLYLETEELEDQLSQLTEAAPLIERLTLSPKTGTLFEALAQVADQETPAENAETLFHAVRQTLEANLQGESQPLSWQSAFSGTETDLHQTVIAVDPLLDHTRVRPAATVQEQIDQVVLKSAERTNINANVFITGDPVLRSDELKSVSQGIGLAFLISFIVVGGILFVALRSPLLVVFVLLSLIISILITSGIAALIYGQLNLVSVAFTVLMVGLGVDFAIHILMTLQSKRRAGLSVPAAFYRTSRGIGTALVLTAPSTALAFLAFVPTKFVGISQLGVVAAIGVTIAFCVATSLLTAIFSYLPVSATATKVMATAPHSAASSQKRRNILAVGVILLGLAALTLMPQAKFDADPMALRDQNAASVKAFEHLFDTPETVPYRLNLLIDNSEDGKALTTQISELESVESVRSLLDFIPKDQYDKLDLIDYAAIGLEFALSGEGTPPEMVENPAEKLRASLTSSEITGGQAFEQTLSKWILATQNDDSLTTRTHEDLFRYWPHQLERLRNQITPSEVALEDLPISIANRYQSQNGMARLEIIPKSDVRDPKNRRIFVSDVKGVAPHVTGSARTVQDAGDIIQTSMLQAVVTALISVSLLLYLVVRNVRLVIIMLIPLILAGVLTTATGVLVNLPYNFANVIVLPLLIGIGVDSSLHLALQNKSEQNGNGQAQPSSTSRNVTARAVVFSAVTTIASFGSLSFSAHRGTSSMGLLLMIAISWVLICTLLVTPALLSWFSQKRDAS